jgi:hypothetical protein
VSALASQRVAKSFEAAKSESPVTVICLYTVNSVHVA